MKPKRLLAFGVLLAGVAAITPLTKAQKPAPPQPTEQQRLKDRVDALESQLKEAQAKADNAAMEKDYIERIQKEVNAYYEKAFNTQLATVTIIALIVGLIGKFGVDHIVQSKLTETTTTLREGFRKELADELQKLKDSNAAQLKQLQDDLDQRIKKGLSKLEDNTQAALFSSLAFSLVAGEKYAEARSLFRSALETVAEHPESFTPRNAQEIITQVFRMIQAADPQKFTEEARKELAGDLYMKFENELNATAIDFPELAQVLKERRKAPPSTLKP